MTSMEWEGQGYGPLEEIDNAEPYNEPDWVYRPSLKAMVLSGVPGQWGLLQVFRLHQAWYGTETASHWAHGTFFPEMRVRITELVGCL